VRLESYVFWMKNDVMNVTNVIVSKVLSLFHLFLLVDYVLFILLVLFVPL